MKEIIVPETIDSFDVHNAPELIRCKDCKNWIAGYVTNQEEFIPSKCGKYHQTVGHYNDDFCSLAERREDDA